MMSSEGFNNSTSSSPNLVVGGLNSNGTTTTGDSSEENNLFTFKFIAEGVILSMVSIFGLVGNSMSIIVLTRTMRGRGSGHHASCSGNSFSNLLRGLATFDALFLTVAIFAFGLPSLSNYYTEHIFVHIMVFVFGLMHTFRVGSVYVTLAVTFERFHAIICPLKHFKWKKYLLPASVFIAVFYNIPKYFELEQQVDPKTNTTKVVSTRLRQNPIYMSLYVFWSKFIFIEMIPYLTILILNIFIIIKITKSARFRKKFRRHDNEDEYGFEEIELEAVGNGHSDSSEDTVANNGGGMVNVNLNGESSSSTTTTGNERALLTRMWSQMSSGSGNSNHFTNQKKKKLVSTSKSVRKCTVHSRRGITAEGPRRTFSKKQLEEHSLGIILISMSSLFIFCQSFKIIPDLYELIICSHMGVSGHYCHMDKGVINAIMRLSHLLVCINSSANFLIYYARGNKFRQAWIETYGQFCCCCCPTSLPPTGSPNGNTVVTMMDGNGSSRRGRVHLRIGEKQTFKKSVPPPKPIVSGLEIEAEPQRPI